MHHCGVELARQWKISTEGYAVVVAVESVVAAVHFDAVVVDIHFVVAVAVLLAAVGPQVK